MGMELQNKLNFLNTSLYGRINLNKNTLYTFTVEVHGTYLSFFLSQNKDLNVIHSTIPTKKQQASIYFLIMLNIVNLLIPSMYINKLLKIHNHRTTASIN